MLGRARPHGPGIDTRRLDQEEVLVAAQALDLVLTHVDEAHAFGQHVGNEVVGGARNEYLATGREPADPRRAVDGAAVVVAVALLSFSGVQRDTSAQRERAWPHL